MRILLLLAAILLSACSAVRAEDSDIDGGLTEGVYRCPDGGCFFSTALATPHGLFRVSEPYVMFMADEDIRIRYDGKTVQLRELLRTVDRLQREVKRLRKQRRK